MVKFLSCNFSGNVDAKCIDVIFQHVNNTVQSLHVKGWEDTLPNYCISHY